MPDTWLLPKRNPDEWADLEHTLRSYASQWDLYEIGEQVIYPFFMKPYDGGGWREVSPILRVLSGSTRAMPPVVAR